MLMWKMLLVINQQSDSKINRLVKVRNNQKPLYRGWVKLKFRKS